MYAIKFELKILELRTYYSEHSYNNAFKELRAFLKDRGFSTQDGNIYFGDIDKINMVTCVLVVMEMSKKFSWFKKCVSKIVMLRIEESNDLTPVL